MAAGNPGVPARNREGGSGRQWCQTACDNNKRTAVRPRPQGGMAVLGKSSPGRCSDPESGHLGEAAVPLVHLLAESLEGQLEVTGRRNWGQRQWRETVGKAVAVVARLRAASPEDQREAAGGRKRQQQPASVCRAAASPAQLQEDPPEDQQEAAGGQKQRRKAAKGPVCGVVESPARLREDSPEDQG